MSEPDDPVPPEDDLVRAEPHGRPPAPVAAGNVETSQRLVDVLLGALAKVLPDEVPAASAGTTATQRTRRMSSASAGISPTAGRGPGTAPTVSSAWRRP